MKRFVAIFSAALILAADEGQWRRWGVHRRRAPPVGIPTAQRSRPPAFTAPLDKAWVKTPVDAFILAGSKKRD